MPRQKRFGNSPAASRRADCENVMNKWFGDPLNFDPDVASDLVDAVWEDRKLLDEHGDLKRSEIALVLKEIFEANHLVNTNTEDAINAGAVTKLELSNEFLAFEGGDSGILKAVTNEEKAARNKVMSVIWECCGTALNSPLNKKLQYLGGPVLMEMTVPRHFTTAEREDLGEMSEDRQGRFVSTNIDVILVHSNDPAIKKLKQAAVRYDGYLGKIGERLPQHKGTLAAAAAAALPQIVESVTNAALPTSSAAVAAIGKASKESKDSDF
jgi:hypothetical protein